MNEKKAVDCDQKTTRAMKDKMKMKIVVLLYVVSFVMLCFAGTTKAQTSNETEAPINKEISGYAHADFEYTTEALTYCKW